MSVQNGERLATKQDLKDMYDRIRPYMGGLVTSKAGFTPIGTIISVMGTTAPVNYLACDGTVYNIADYTELANYFNEQFGSKNYFGGDGTTTFAVPDLRGEFLRGTGSNGHTGEGNGAAVGAHQDATRIPAIYTHHGGQIGVAEYSTTADYFLKDADSSDGTRQYVSEINFTQKHVSAPANIDAGYATLRPTNTSVLYCIATKNFYIDPTLDYSTDEKVVGTWIDGKPIYQKTIPYNVTTYTEAGSRRSFTVASVNGVDSFVDFKFTWKPSGWGGYFMGTTMSGDAKQQFSYYGFVDISTYVLSAVIQTAISNNITSMEGVATLQYTKTTT